MSRIACLHIPNLPIVAHQKHDPELKDRPFALIGGRSAVRFCSRKAGAAMVAPGMRLSQARALCAELLWRDYDESLYRQAQKELLADLISCSPRVSASAGSFANFLLDAGGLRHMGGEGKLCRELLKLVSRRGYTEASVGIADSAFAATVAALSRRRWLLVPEGGDREFLAGLPIEYLPVEVETRQTLKSLGIDRIGEFTALAPDEICSRFGAGALAAYHLACGLDARQPSIPVKEKSYHCLIDLGGPVESLTDTIFVIKSLIDRLALELARESLCVEELAVAFYNDNELIEERPIRMMSPSSNSKFLLEVLRLSLESKPIAREFTALELAIVRTAPESRQQLSITGTGDEQSDLLRSKSGDALSLLLARIAVRLGDEALVRPVLDDQYFHDLAGRWQPVIERSGGEPAAVNVAFVEQSLGPSGLVSEMVLKKCGDIDGGVPVMVEFQESRPGAVNFEGLWYEILAITVPECLSGLWWEAPVRRSCYRALIRSPFGQRLLVMLVYDHELRAWHIEGIFD
ncbi:MAG: DNA polymerase Y family protein [Cyanobacteria bacterium HKST-UBA02]|nr:DNA polymerase Y family protein [Cyanobacteria bacterium HKST-UBA02]